MGLSRLLEAAGASVVSLPLIEIREPQSWQSLDAAISKLDRYHWIVFTSANAVRFFMDRALAQGSGSGDVKANIAAVGASTRDALERHGLKVAFQPGQTGPSEKITSEAIADHLLNMVRPVNDLRILIPCSNLSNVETWRRLTDVGATVDFVEAYQNVRPALNRANAMSTLQQARGGYILFASPSALMNLSSVIGSSDLVKTLEPVNVVCIGPTTAGMARDLGVTAFLEPPDPADTSIFNLICEDVLGKKL